MPKFLTISPTHVPGRKQFAWQQFRDGGYIAIGWIQQDMTGKTIEEIIGILRAQNYENEASAIDAFTKFLKLGYGDYVAVNNVNHGLFGVGILRSGYKFEKGKHDTGSGDQDDLLTMNPRHLQHQVS